MIDVLDVSEHCPGLEALEAMTIPSAIHDHVTGCRGCRLVASVLAAPRDEDPCLRFEPLIAARGDGSLTVSGTNLLQRHLASCSACRELAETLAPRHDAAADRSTLPDVDPSAYAVGAEVARGGMGRILEARDLRVGRPVAIKELLGNAPHLAARFEREARITARLQHPGIVPIYEIGRWPDGTPFYTMRMVEGRTLREAIDGARSLTERVALLPSILAACDAVAFAHEHVVVHRDLTPSNVLVGAFGETVVIDWGLAKDAEIDDLAIAGTVMGTASYMPPEQASGAEVDARADVYALGAILYHLLAGHAPYRGTVRGDLIKAVRASAPAPIHDLEPHAPRDLVSIVEKAMARDPSVRYPSARQLADELRRFQTGRVVEAHTYSRGERVRRFVGRHRAVVVATAIAVGLLAIVGVAAVTRIVRSRAETEATLRFVLEEQGRAELLDEDTPRALAYLEAAYQRGARGTSLGFMYAAAVRSLAVEEATLDCGSAARSLDFTSDGKDVAVACHDRAKIWHLGTTADPIILPVHDGGYDYLAYSHDNTVLATWGSDGTSRVWNARTGELVGEFVHGAGITFTTFTPDDQRLLTSGGDGTVKLWNRAEPSEPLRTIPVTSGPSGLLLGDVYGVLSRDGKTILTTTMEGEARGWNADTGARRDGGFEHGSFVLGGEVAQAGPERAVSCGINKLVKVWDATTGRPLHTLAGHADVVFKCTFSPDGMRVLSTSHDGTAKVWDPSNGTLVTTANNNNNSIWTGHFSPDGRRFVTADLSGIVRVWDASTGALLATHDNAGGKEAKFSPDNTRIVALRGDGRVRIWSNTAGSLRTSFASKRTISRVGLDGTRALVTDASFTPALWDTTTNARIPHVDLADPVELGETTLVAATTANTTVLLDLATGATLRTFPIARPRHLSVAAGAPRIAAVVDTRLEIWEEEHHALATFEGARSPLLDAPGMHVAFVRGEDHLVATVGPQAAVKALVRKEAPGGPRGLRIIGFASGNHLVGLEDTTSDKVKAEKKPKTMIVWDSNSGAEVYRLDKVTSATIAPGGDFLTTVSPDRLVQIVRMSDRQIIATFVGDRQLLQAQCDRDARLVAAITEYGAAAVILTANDGRTLARWPIEHSAPSITQNDITPVHAEARWSRDGKSVATIGVTVALWHATTEISAADRARVRRHVPWRIVDGRVQLVRARMRGTVSRDGAPLANTTISISNRRPPDDAGGQYTWDSLRAEVASRTAKTDDSGAFELRDLVLGEYEIVVGDHQAIVTLDGDDRDLAIALH